MSNNRYRFSRPIGTRHYRTLYVVAVEGSKTEPQYFQNLNIKNASIKIECLSGKTKNSPLYVLKRIKKHLYENSLKNHDEAWLVVDKDNWSDEQLEELHAWSLTASNYGFALTNPNFEYWLLLHFEDGANVNSSSTCLARLKQHIPNYSKKLNHYTFSTQQIHDAIRRAKLRDKPPCCDWPRTVGTTVYKLVEKLLSAP